MMQKILYLLMLTLTVGHVSAQNRCFGDVSQPAFAPGEVLFYTASYSAAIVSTNVADITMRTLLDRHQGKVCYKIWATGKTKPFFDMFYKIEDNYTTWIDTLSMRPLRAASELKEGGYQYRTNFLFNWLSKTVSTEGHNVKRNVTYRKILSLGDCSFDALSLFYNIRSMDMQNLKPNRRFNLSLVLEDTIRNISVRFLERTTYTIASVGKIRTLKFACQFATSNDETFKDGAEFYIWVSDDENRIPVYLESPIKVGKVKVALRTWSGLKHPFSSIIIN